MERAPNNPAEPVTNPTGFDGPSDLDGPTEFDESPALNSPTNLDGPTSVDGSTISNDRQLEVLNRIAARLDMLTSLPASDSEISQRTEPSSSGIHSKSSEVHSKSSEEIDSSPRHRRRFTEVAAMGAVVIAACAIAVALLGPAPAKAATAPPVKKVDPPPTCTGSSSKLTVQGTGTATATPNLLTLVLEVDVSAPNAQDALSADNAQAAAIEHSLAVRGVSAKDIQTTNLSIQPNYSWEHNTSILTGYAVSNDVTVNFHAPFKIAGGAIDAVAAIAGNDIRVDGLNFSFSNPASVEDQARNNAVTQAVAHAGSMAAAAHEQLGAVCSVTDNSTVQPEPFAMGDPGFAADAVRQAVPVQPGSQQETDQVTVVYALKPAS